MTDASTDVTIIKPKIKRLLAQRRQQITDDESEDEIKERTIRGPGDTPKTIEINLSQLYRPAVSTTGDVELLKLEAELVAEGKELGNPHVPATVDLLNRATEQIEANGHTPAWENGL